MQDHDFTVHTQQEQHTATALRYSHSTPSMDEIHKIIKGMRSNAAPGPDGLNAAFYKSCWNWIKDDVYQVVLNFYNDAIIPPDINKTFIAPIPKNNQPLLPQDYRPIGL
jgi:hypothetical protein